MDMSLLDIDDFSLRSQVAQLMAVAPALAVIDLYHLIIDSEGDIPRAKKHAIRMSEAPGAQYRPVVDSDGDEIMVKIDPNDPAFEWDDDEPQPESEARSIARLSKTKPKARSKTGSSAAKSKSLHHSTKSAKSAKSDTKHRPNICAKRTKSVPLNPAHARETSSDRDFVVPDNVIHYDVDLEISEDSDQSTSTDVRNRYVDSDSAMLDGDDPLGLDIDMQPRFAYNARLLGDIRRARKT
jgi:hypothetical protein